LEGKRKKAGGEADYGGGKRRMASWGKIKYKKRVKKEEFYQRVRRAITRETFPWFSAGVPRKWVDE